MTLTDTLEEYFNKIFLLGRESPKKNSAKGRSLKKNNSAKKFETISSLLKIR